MDRYFVCVCSSFMELEYLSDFHGDDAIKISKNFYVIVFYEMKE